MLLTEPLLSCPYCVFGVIGMQEDPDTTHLQYYYWGKEVVGQNLMIHGPIHPPLNTVQLSSPLFAEKHPQNIHASRLGWGSWDCTHPSFSKHGEWSLYQKVIFWSHLTFSHASSGSSRWSLANFRRAWTCAGLSSETLRVLQDFNPWWCSVLLMVTVETVVPALFRSLTWFFRVVLC